MSKAGSRERGNQNNNFKSILEFFLLEEKGYAKLIFLLIKHIFIQRYIYYTHLGYTRNISTTVPKLLSYGYWHRVIKFQHETIRKLTGEEL